MLEITGGQGVSARITLAAERLFSERGYEGVSMQQVALEAGVSKALIYYHFKDKRELYNELLKRAAGVLIETAEAARKAAVSGTAAADAFEAFIDGYFEAASSRPGLLHLAWRELAAAQGAASEYVLLQLRRAASALVEMVQAGLDGGEFQAVDAKLAVMSLLGLLDVFLWRRLPVSVRFTPEVASRHVRSVFLEGLTGTIHGVAAAEPGRGRGRRPAP